MRLRKSTADGRALVRQIAAWCLHYPDAALRDRLPLLHECLAETPPGAAALLAPVLAHLRDSDPGAAERHYVEVFDTRARRCLYLTWYTDGDTRRRGRSLAELKSRYRSGGFHPPEDELPDYLPMVLEFAARGGQAGERVVAEFRPALHTLHQRLADLGTPYASAVAAVLDTVPAKGKP
ncbi:nitrate reductase molybdenum cofactor assembly chaperone [Actinokineospora sp. NPDC004072]